MKRTAQKMSLNDAIAIVLELARQNVLDDPHEEMRAEVKRQEKALRIVERIARSLPKDGAK